MNQSADGFNYWIGIDNGVSGSVAILAESQTGKSVGVFDLFSMPVRKEISYTKAAHRITRVDYPKLLERLSFKHNLNIDEDFVTIERPFVNPKGLLATLSAMRSLEATLIVLEQLQLPYDYIDSRQWQKALLPSGLKGPKELKSAGIDIARRLYPTVDLKDYDVADADALLIAHWRMSHRLLSLQTERKKK